ncbi:MAG: RtcB family protein [Desulfococcaceae bacterium]
MSIELKPIDDYRWELPQTGAMQAPGRIYGTKKLIEALQKEGSIQQIANVATLPGILDASLAMPDAHQGYGFTIGGVAAFDWETGIVSPGGVGYDINCGVRLARTHLTEEEVRPRIRELVEDLFRNVPSGVGSTGPVKLDKRDEKRVLEEGAGWAVRQGFGEAADLDHTEDGGRMAGADPETVSDRAMERGRKQLGTLGSGNHFLEVGVVDEIFDPTAAGAFGLFEGQVTVMIHTGSRGFGYQVCDDFLARMAKAVKSLPFALPDRQLACAPVQSETGRDYLAAMACAANYAWANRQILLHRARETFQKSLGISPRDLGMRLVYDVCHNVAKRETHTVDGKKRTVCVHRKGATRSFPKGHPDVPADYRSVGQPVLAPGDMGTASYVLVGTETAMAETFGSTCHGAGRALSRKAAKKAAKGRALHRELEDRGVFVKWTGRSTMSEEMPDAYKDVSEVVEAVHGAGISRKVARLRPIGVVKG